MDCFQKPNSQYKEVAIDRFMRKCSYKDMKENAVGTCLLDKYKRSSKKKKYYCFGSKCSGSDYENPW